MHSSHANIDIEKERQIAERLKSQNDNVISLIGEDVTESIAWTETCDLFVSPWGAGLAKYKWVNNIKGVVFSSKCVLEEKNDLRIYDTPEYRELAVADIWYPSEFSTNADYATLQEYKSAFPNGNAYYYQNFDIKIDKLIEIVKQYIHSISISHQELQHQSLKRISIFEELL